MRQENSELPVVQVLVDASNREQPVFAWNVIPDLAGGVEEVVDAKSSLDFGRISLGLAAIRTLSISKPFESLTASTHQINYPVSLTMIQERLANGFYRSTAAILFDARAFVETAKRVWYQHPEIVRGATIVSQLIEDVVNSSQADVVDLYIRRCPRDEKRAAAASNLPVSEDGPDGHCKPTPAKRPKV